MATRTDKKWKAFLIGVFFHVRNNHYIYKFFLNRKYKYLNVGIVENSTLRQKVINDLEKFGISLVSISEILENGVHAFTLMENWIKANEINLKQKKRKKYLFSYYGTEDGQKPLDLENPIVKFYLQETILDIVCSYLGYVPQLFEIYIEKTMPIGTDAPTYSQNWHRDPEEKRTLKVFLYLNDVEEESGPFTYLKGSAPTSGGPYSKLFPQELPHGCYPNPTEVDAAVKRDDVVKMIGEKGTVIFCDTAGLHKGGHATTKSRIMATAFFPSKRYSLQKQFKTPDKFIIKDAKLGDLASKILGV